MATITWTGAAHDGLFSDAFNWSGNVLPGTNDDVVITPGTSTSITSPSSPTIHSLSLNANVTLSINGSTTFGVTNGTNGSGIAGTLDITNAAVLFLGGAVVNSGTINEQSTGNLTDIRLTANATLSGGGHIILSAGPNNRIFGNNGTQTLTNLNNTISGSGDIGAANNMTLVNAGVINANNSGAALTIDDPNIVTTNTGTLEATSGGTLVVNSPINNVGGIIEAVGAGSTVTLQSSISGGTITGSGGGTILSSGALLDGLPLHPVTILAPIQVLNNNVLFLEGNIVNNSAINLDGSVNNTDLRMSSPVVTLQGTGSVNLINSANNRIFGQQGAFEQLINQSNTIDGSGQLGAAQLTFTNKALVDANSTLELFLNTSNEVTTNTGILQSSNTGGLGIQSTVVNNVGGTIQALVAGSHVDLLGGTVAGGTLKTANGGVIETVSGNGGLDGLSFGTLNNTGTVLVNDQTILFLSGTINNTGVINENQLSTGGATRIRINSQVVTLSGAGHLNMTNNGLNVIEAQSANTQQFVNVNNTIAGAGLLGNGSLTIINKAAGIINANQPNTATTPGLLTLNTNNSILTNQGLLESTNTGGLLILNTAVNNAGGTVLASGVGSLVELSASTIQGGTLLTASGGIIETVSGNGGLDGFTDGVLNNKGTVLVTSQTHLNLAGTINNTGVINEDQVGGSGNTQILLTSLNVTLQGGGQVLLSQATGNLITGNDARDQLVNVNNTISGGGQIGPGNSAIYLVNQAAGVINSNGTASLTLNSADLATNTGLMEDTGTGGFIISGTAVYNAGGTIQASGANSHVDLTSADIIGGKLVTAAGGSIDTSSGDRGSVLDGASAGALNNQGNFVVSDNSSVTLAGTINNTGTITMASVGNVTQIRIGNQAVTLTGGGKLVMSNEFNNEIFGNSGLFQLVNVNNTISGAGQIGPNGSGGYFVNHSLVNANQVNQLLISTSSFITTNTGTMEATGTVAGNGGLVIQNTVVNNAGGTILASGVNGHVNLDGAYIEGGVLTTSASGLIEIATAGASNTGTLDGITEGVLANKGTLAVSDRTRLGLVGTINNTGTIQQQGTSGITTIRVVGQNAILTGSGQLVMTDNINNVIDATAATNTLINQGNTIGGAGNIGNGAMELVNQSGIIQGTGTNPLLISLGSGNGVNNAGAAIIAKGTGGVQFVGGIFTNNGAIDAFNGSTLVYQSGATNTNLNEGQLVGGTWQALSTGSGATIDMTGGSIVTDAAILVVSGVNSTIQGGNGSTFTPIEQTLASITAAGQLQVLANRGYTTSLDLVDGGFLKLGGGIFHANSLTISAGGRVVGFGTISNAPFNNGVMEAQSGLLDVTGNVTGSGTLQVDNVSTVELGGTAAQTVNFAAGGVGKLKIDTATKFAGTITNVAVGDAIDLANVTPASITSISWLNQFPKLIIQNGTTTIVSYSSVTGVAGVGPSADHWVVTSDGGTGANLTLTAGASTASISGAITGPGGGSGAITSGVDQSWIGGFGNSFNTASNWNPAVVPGSGDDAVIGAGFAVVSSQGNAVSSLTVGAGSTLTVGGSFVSFSVINGTDAAGISGTIAVLNSDVLDLGATIINHGSIISQGNVNNTDIVFTQATNTLTGGGQVILGNSANNRLYASAGTDVLNNVNNTISGAGQLGASQLTFTNSGTVNANQPATPLTVNTSSNIINNAGLMEATAGAQLAMQSPVNNVGGTVQAVGTGSLFLLENNVIGGTVTSGSGGVVQSLNGPLGSGQLDGLGLHPVTVSGTVVIPNANPLFLDGSIINNGSINLASTGNFTDLRLNSAIVTLTGTGSINLGNNANNRIFGNSAAFKLVNQTNTIAGAGQLGSVQMTFSNAGLVNANQTNPLLLNTQSNLVTNTGNMEDTGTGGLQIQNTAVVNTGGTIQSVGAGAHVDLLGGNIQGGTLNGLVQTVPGNNGVIDGITAGVLTNNGTAQATDLTTLFLAGTINNVGMISVHQVSFPGNTNIELLSQIVALQGGGQVVMTNNGGNRIFAQAASETLVNVNNTISGAGQLGAAQMTLVNQAAGVINANDNPTFNQSGQLIVRTDNQPAVNAGIMEATTAGGLVIQNTAVNNTGGTIQALGATAHVDLLSSAIEGGTLITGSGGVIDTGDKSSTLDGVTFGQVNNTGKFLVSDQTEVNLEGVINNTGTIVEDQESAGGSTLIRILSQFATLTGGGQVQLSNFFNNQIFGQAAVDTLINANNTITGSGQFGSAQMTFVNQAAGIVNANQSTQLLVRTDNEILTNAGLMEATGPGSLVFQNTAVNNAGGTILASGTGATVGMLSSAIEGGLLIGNGAFQLQDRASTLDGITHGSLTIQGTVQIPNTQALTLAGVINNTGTIQLAATGVTNTTDLAINSQTVTLQGGGSVLMSNNNDNRIFGDAGTDTLINVNNIIAGAGQIGTSATMFMTNQSAGVINANTLDALVMRFDANVMTNQGTMEATSTIAGNGGLMLFNSTFLNAGGTIKAVGANAHVDLNASAVEGGMLTSSGGGVIQTDVTTASSLDGVTAGVLVNTGTVVVNDDSRLNLTGTINNTGTLKQTALSANVNTDVQIIAATGEAVGTATLTGNGQWLMSDNPNNRVYAPDARWQLINNGNTIQAAGQFGLGTDLNFTNASGTLNAFGTNALNINLGSDLSVNNGLMSATGAGGMVLVSGVFTNNGVMTAFDGSSITFQSGALNTNLAEGVLLGGSWVVNAAGHGATLSMTGGPITTDDASIVLAGVGSVIQAGTGTGVTPYQPLEQTLGTITAGANLIIGGGRPYSSTQNLLDNGIVWLQGSGVFQTNSFTIGSTGILKGSGPVNDAITNGGTIQAQGATLTVNGNVTGSGTLSAISGATLLLNGGSSTAGTITDAGTLILSSGHSLVDNGNLTGTGTLQTNSGAVLTLNGASNTIGKVVDNGSINLGTGDNLTVSGNETVGGTMQVHGGTLHAGTLVVASGGVLAGFGTVSNAVANSGRVEANGGTFTVTGAVTGTGTLQADSGATLVLNGAANTASTVVDNAIVSLGTGDNLTVSGNATVNGSATLKLAGGTLQAGALAVAGTGVLLGSGTVNDALVTAGKVEANSGTLAMTGAVTGTGALQADSGAALNLNGASNAAGSVLDNGTVNIGASDSLNVTGSVNSASSGVFVLTNASLLQVAADTAGSSTHAINFLGASGDTLAVGAVGSFGNFIGTTSYTGPKLLGFANTVDTIDLKNLIFNSGTNVATIDSYTAGTGLLQLHSGTTKATLFFNNGDLGTGSFHLAADSGTGTVITHS